MSTAQTATSVKAPLDGAAASQTVEQTVGQVVGEMGAQLGGSGADQAASSVVPGGDAMAGAVGTLGQTGSLVTWGSYFQALAVLFFIVALLFVALWFLKRKGGLTVLTRQGDLLLESRMALGPKKSLVVVRFLNKRVLLGVTDQQITMLTELPTDEDDTEHPAPYPANPPDFKAHPARAARDGIPSSG